ncbi:MAG: peptidoglycan DD-metalloendopeptidase family protein [Burkholderiaceae bacterium]|nr:peptidoglycan DD-metalloendopeptidase family protein [Burkholderiaceae bacterium]
MIHFRLPSGLLSAAVLALMLAGCGSKPTKAPVEDRRPPKAAEPAAAASKPAPPVSSETPKPLPGAENAGRAGYYTVKPGDTMIRIGLENGQNWRDIVRWNGIENPNLIEVGQVLRVVPPGVDASSVASRGVAPPQVEARPLEARPVAAAASAAPAASSASAPAPAAPREVDEEPAWAWPAGGPVLAGFEEGRQKGLLIAGKAGDPVFAAADGRIVYAGSGLRGYGNLVIVKHNNTYLTAYAHNQTLLVKEDQVVRRGQKIAEMGSSDADRVQLHFEIRRQGKPVDPARQLPPR